MPFPTKPFEEAEDTVQTTGAAIDQGAEAEEEIENKELDELERKDLERLLMMDTFPWNLD
jgi:hypothetical protein